MTNFDRYKRENNELNDYHEKIYQAYQKLEKDSNAITEFPSQYGDEIQEIRTLVRQAQTCVMSIRYRKRLHNPFDQSNRKLINEIDLFTQKIKSMILRCYQPYELAVRSKERLESNRRALRAELGVGAKEDLDWLFDTMDRLPVLKEKYGELSQRTKMIIDNAWITDAQIFQEELKEIIEHSKLVYRKWYMSQYVSDAVHRKIVFTCRTIIIQLDRWLDPIFDIPGPSYDLS